MFKILTNNAFKFWSAVTCHRFFVQSDLSLCFKIYLNSSYVKLSLIGRSLILLLCLLVLPAYALDITSVNASLDSSTLYQGWPVKGSLEITHSSSDAIDEKSVTLDNKPLAISLLRNVQISQDSTLLVSIYHFTLPAFSEGSFTLSPISVKIGKNIYKSNSLPFTIQGPIAMPKQNDTAPAKLQLEAFIEGPSDLYPGQVTNLVYRYIYQGSISLTKENLPMLEIDGLQMMGRKETKNYNDNESSIFEISQKVQALKPGDYSWGPSLIEGTVYVTDSLGNPQYTNQVLKSEAPVVKLNVKPFPEKNKPVSFSGALGDFKITSTLLSSADITLGDPVQVKITIQGTTDNWDMVLFPELCCQPGFSGFFATPDLPPIGDKEKDSKSFTFTMQTISKGLNQIPSIEFSFFDPESSSYKKSATSPLPLKISQAEDILELSEFLPEKETKNKVQDWAKIYGTPHVVDIAPIEELNKDDIKRGFWSYSQLIYIVPIVIAMLIVLSRLKKINLQLFQKIIKPFIILSLLILPIVFIYQIFGLKNDLSINQALKIPSNAYEQELEINKLLKKYLEIENKGPLTSTKFYNNLGKLQFMLEQYPESYFYFQKALQLDPENATTKENSAKALTALNRVEVEDNTINKIDFYLLNKNFLLPILFLTFYLGFIFYGLYLLKDKELLKSMAAFSFFIGGITLIFTLYVKYIIPASGILLEPSLVYSDQSFRSAPISMDPLASGEKLTVINIEKDWLKVRLKEDKVGYIPSSKLAIL